MAGTARFVNMDSVEKALLSAFREWSESDVNDKYWREKFEEPWPYPGPPTIRKSKPPAGDPRDILDTEELYESGVRSYRYQAGPNGARADWHWDATNSSGEEYAWFVHEGQGPYARVARPWTDEIASPGLFEGSEIKRKLLVRIEDKLNGRQNH